LIVCDVIPNPPETAFLKEAWGRTEHTLDGLAMLVYHPVIGIRMWTGRDASVSVMKDALSEAFSG
jgi:shikimate dehydrogenase